MDKKIIIYAVVFLAAVLLAGLLWPKDKIMQPFLEEDNLLVEEHLPENNSLPEEDNKQITEGEIMEIKLDNNVTEEITPSQGPVMQIDENANYNALIKTSKGDIKIKLDASKTPITVNNFIYLARKGFYDNTIFHRTISGFMIQGGDPLGNGTGGPGYQFNDEPFYGEYKRGIIAMANAGANTNGSQFFIMHQETLLPPNYVIFGQVEKGMDVVDAIAEAEAKANVHGELSVPINPVNVLTVEIFQVKPIE